MVLLLAPTVPGHQHLLHAVLGGRLLHPLLLLGPLGELLSRLLELLLLGWMPRAAVDRSWAEACLAGG